MRSFLLSLLLLLYAFPLLAVPSDTLSADGPYILYHTEAPTQVISVNPQGKLMKQEYDPLPRDFSFEVVSHDGVHRFPVTLHPVERPTWKCGQPDKLFVMSDPHGNLDCFVSLLQGNGILGFRQIFKDVFHVNRRENHPCSSFSV